MTEADQAISVFANAGAGNHDGGSGMLGVRYSFGMRGTTLKVQHREYDPPNIVNAFTSGDAGGNGIVHDVTTHEEKPTAVIVPGPARSHTADVTDDRRGSVEPRRSFSASF